MIKATEAAFIAYAVQTKDQIISDQMKELISNQIRKAAQQGQTRTGFNFGGDKDYCLAVAKWAKGFGYSAWIDNSRGKEIFWLGWNEQTKFLREREESYYADNLQSI